MPGASRDTPGINIHLFFEIASLYKEDFNNMEINNKAVTILKYVNDIILKIETFLLSLFTLTLVVVIFIEVICRYLLFISTAWAEELARYLFVWLTYIGSAYALSEGGHIEIDVFKQLLVNVKSIKNKERVIQFLEIISLISTMIFLLMFCYLFWDYMLKIWVTNQTSPTMHIPMGLVYLPVFVGIVVSIYHEVYLLSISLTKYQQVKKA